MPTSYINIPQMRASASAQVNTIDFFSFSANETYSFYAFLTDFNDQFTSNWSTTEIYGRMDPVFNFKNTVRKITLGFDVPSAYREEAEANASKADKMFRAMYPVYHQAKESPGTALIGSPPLWRIRFGSLIIGMNNSDNSANQNAKETGLLGWIDGLAFKPDIESGWFLEAPDGKNKPYDMFPKLFKLNFTFNVIHEHPLGFTLDVSGSHVSRIPKSKYTFPHHYDVVTGEPVYPDESYPQEDEPEVAESTGSSARVSEISSSTTATALTSSASGSTPASGSAPPTTPPPTPPAKGRAGKKTDKDTAAKDKPVESSRKSSKKK